MLSIAKLRVGREAYQLSGVAQSLEDYYAGRGEAAGWWVGGSAARLGLDVGGVVDGDDLSAILAGLAPGRGGLTPNGEALRVHPRRVPGFDLTFKAPKSVSVLWALTDDPKVQGAIIEGCEAAVRDAIGWLERDVIRVRRGSHNTRVHADRDRDATAVEPGDGPRTIPVAGIVGAVFRHRTSRLADPLLHWHVLVANLAEGADGRWSALVHPDIYQAARTAGEVFQASLRRELTARIGLDWTLGRHVHEVAGIPTNVLAAFSKRRAEIDAYLDANHAARDPRSQQAATLATRRRKPELEGAALDTAWKTEATELGFGPAAVARLLDHSRPANPDAGGGWWQTTPTTAGDRDPLDAGGDIVDRAGWVGAVLRELTDTTSTFTRHDVIRAVAARLTAGAAPATVTAIADQVLTDPQTVTIATNNETLRYSSAELVDTEQRFTRLCDHATVTALDPTIVDATLTERPSIGDDQAAAVRVLCGSGRAVSVLIGPAGTGKTYTMGAVAAAYRNAGYHVIGAAPSARAAIELDDAAIDASTMHRLTARIDLGHQPLDRSTVLIVDEAAMAGIRHLEALTSRVVAAGGRVILVGDHHQLPAITAGGGFAAAAQRPAGVAQLVTNRRQTHRWEQDALWALRDGDITIALAAYRDRDRVTIADNRTAMIDQAAEQWCALDAAGHQPVLLAGTRQLVDDLNSAVRARRIRTGHVHPATPDGWFGLGDRVVIRHNRYRAVDTDGVALEVINGHTGTITSLRAGAVTIRLDRNQRHVELPTRLPDGRPLVEHAYALTAHRAQGGTWTHSISVGLDGLYHEAAYVQLSRGRDANWFILTGDDQQHLDDLTRHVDALPHPDDTPDDLDDRFEHHLTRSGAKQFATITDPDAADIDRLARTHPPHILAARARDAAVLEHDLTAVTGIDISELETRYQRARHNAARITVTSPVRALDRHNYGTVTAINEPAGTLTVQFTNSHGTAVREFAWHEIQPVGDPPARPLTSITEARLALDARHLDHARQQCDDRLAAAGYRTGDTRRYQRAFHQVVEHHTLTRTHNPPDAIVRLIGPAPTGGIAWHAWHQTLTELTRHQLTHQHPDHNPLGSEPAAGPDHDQWERLHQQALHTRRHHAADTTHPAPVWTNPRTLDELHHRLDELDTLLATAPADTRTVIERLTRQAGLWDNTSELVEAIDTLQARHHWIRTNWPHIIEHHETSRALHHGPHAHNVEQALEHLARHTLGPLADAAHHRDPWIEHAIRHLTSLNHPVEHPDTIQLLDDIATWRHTNHITTSAPLGAEPGNPTQATEWHDLTSRVPKHDRPTAAIELGL